MDFMTRRIAHLMEEQENQEKPIQTRDLDIIVVRTLEESQNTEIPIPDDEGILPLDLKK